MRVILSNDDAREFEALIGSAAFAGVAIPDPRTMTVLLRPSPEVGGGSGVDFKCKTRSTPGSPGSFVVEDWDGRALMEGVS